MSTLQNVQHHQYRGESDEITISPAFAAGLCFYKESPPLKRWVPKKYRDRRGSRKITRGVYTYMSGVVIFKGLSRLLETLNHMYILRTKR